MVNRRQPHLRKRLPIRKQSRPGDISTSYNGSSPRTATATAVEGTATITDKHGDTTSEDVTDADEPFTMDYVKYEAKWYLDFEAPF